MTFLIRQQQITSKFIANEKEKGSSLSEMDILLLKNVQGLKYEQVELILKRSNYTLAENEISSP